jgi:D-alanyl-D-alanine carboxypeptidase
LVSNPKDLVVWARALFEGEAIEGNYLDELLRSVPVSEDDSTVRYGAGVAIYEDGPIGRTFGHGGWIPGYSSSLRYYPEHDIGIAFQINTDIGIVDHSTPVVEEMEKKLAETVVSAIEVDTSSEPATEQINRSNQQ